MKVGHCEVKILNGRSKYSYALARSFIDYIHAEYKTMPSAMSIKWGKKITDEERSCDIIVDFSIIRELYEVNVFTYFGKIDFTIEGVIHGRIPSE